MNLASQIEKIGHAFDRRRLLWSVICVEGFYLQARRIRSDSVIPYRNDAAIRSSQCRGVVARAGRVMSSYAIFATDSAEHHL